MKAASEMTIVVVSLSWLGQHGLLLHINTCLLMSLSVSHSQLVFEPLSSISPSLTSVLHCSRPIGMTHLYLTFSMAIDHLYASHLHTNTKRHVSQTLTLGLVSNSTKTLSSSNNLSSQLDTHGNISTMCLQSYIQIYIGLHLNANTTQSCNGSRLTSPYSHGESFAWIMWLSHFSFLC